MALVAQHIPKVGLVMDEIKVVRWLKGVGDEVVAGEPLIEVETEKSMVEIEAAATGRLTEILVAADGRAAVGDQVAWIESDAAAAGGMRDATPAGRDAAHGTAVAGQRDGAARGAARGDAAAGGARIPSTPVARKLAAAHGIDIGAVAGSGPAGRVQLDDVQRAVDARVTRGAAEPQPLSPMRRALARAMSLSNATVPQFTVSRAVEWTVLQALRAELAAKQSGRSTELSATGSETSAKPTLTDFLLQSVARALIELPALNAVFSGDPDSADARIVPASGAHIGLVVAVDNGLLVPVIHGVEMLTLGEIARRRNDAVKRSLKGRLKREELEGATFSISNLGVEGPDRFTAIINPPQSAILAVGRQRDCAVAREGAVVVRPMSDLTLTVDHRVADGRLASKFLARVVEILEGRDWRME